MSDVETIKLGRVVRRMREKRGWTQTYLATITGMERVRLVRMEGGVGSRAYLRDVQVFAHAFGVEPCDLLRKVIAAKR